MSTRYDVARPAKQVFPGSAAPPALHLDGKTVSYRPPHPNQSSSRSVPAESISLPQTSWLSDVAEFTTSPLSQSYLAVGVSAPGPDFLLSSGSLSDSGQPSYSLHRARSRDYLLSTSASPTLPAVPCKSGSRSPLSPSPVPSVSHTLHTSRSFTASSPHKTSAGVSSDRDASGHLDLKRLMSKPAKQTSSGSVSLLSDSERSADASSSRIAPSRRPSATASESAASRPPLSRSAHASREKMSLHVNTSGLRSSSAPRHGHTSSSPERKPAAGSDNQTGKSSRNVLRRRPSARSNPATPSASVTTTRAPAATENFVPPVRSASIKRTQPQHEPLNEMPVASPARHPSFSPPTPTTRPGTSPRATKGSVSSPKGPQIPTGLTPAGAVALAYKQQEQRREELAETASFNDGYRPSSTTPVAPSPINMDASPRNAEVSNALDDGGDTVESHGPYYTVFGSSSGRLVAVGSPEDDWHYGGGFDARAAVTVNGKSPSNSSRSLTRKVSGSLKRVAGSMKRDRELREFPVPQLDEWKPYDGSKATPSRGGSSPSHSQSKGSRMPTSLDTPPGKCSPRASPTAKHSPAQKSSPSPKEDDRPSRAPKTKGRDQEDESPSGGKWWKLVKRISTGGLRDKYQSQDQPPPVPALPQNISHLTPSRTTMDISSRGAREEEVSENGVLLRRFMQSRSSLSGVRPTLTPSLKAPSSGSSRPSTSTGAAARPSTGNTTKSRMSMSGHRTAATRSSSPGSSEMAPPSLFNHNRTPSARSSFSSFGEEVPPVPKKVGQYIIAPSELSRMTRSSEQVSSTHSSKRTRTPSRAHTAPDDVSLGGAASSSDDRGVPSLPLPPRRATAGAASSPMSASFSLEDTINTLMPPHASVPPPLGEFGMQEPPPRPKRSSRRAPPPNVDVPARSQSMSATFPRSPQTPRGPPVRVDVDLARRPSTGALSYASTARQHSSSNSPASALTSPSSGASQRRSPLTFREMQSPRHKLTEKEKADAWEDLLERSARAGGTLRVGESRLLSDGADVDGNESLFDSYMSDSDA